MTEAQWLASEDPAAMLACFGDGQPRHPSQFLAPSDRKLRLFACACCRQLWQFLNERDRKGVGLAERWADGEAVHSELYDLVSDSQGVVRSLHFADASAVAFAVVDSARRHNPRILPPLADLLREIVGNPFRRVTLCGLERKLFDNQFAHLQGSGGFWLESECPYCREIRTPQLVSLAMVAHEGQWCEHCNRELRSHCRECFDAEARRPHRLPDGTLDPFRLALVADALEEAGCQSERLPVRVVIYGRIGGHAFDVVLRRGGAPEDEELYTGYSLRDAQRWAHENCAAKDWNKVNNGGIRSPYEQGSSLPYLFADGLRPAQPHPLLAHLRSPGPHVRGCWALDLILGKE